jgi:hypothetical protein
MRVILILSVILVGCGCEVVDTMAPECDVCEAFYPGSYPVHGPDDVLYCQPMWECETAADCEEGATCSEGWCSIGVCG